MDFAEELLTDDLRDELIPLLHRHFVEISDNQDIELDPDWAAYRAIQDTGGLRIYTVRHDAGFLVGYAVYFVKHNLHYSRSLQADQDILFLDEEHRGRMTGYRFIKWCDDRLAEIGCQVVYHHVKEAHNFGTMLERQGYGLVETIWSKRLDEEASWRPADEVQVEVVG